MLGIDPVLLVQIALIVVVFHALLLSAAGMVWAERKVAARLQQRFGPTLTGPAGLLQPFADVFKLFFKEELKPKAADSVLFYLAPIISAMTAFLAFCVVPFGRRRRCSGCWTGRCGCTVADVQRRGPGHLRRRLDGRLRHRPGGLELEQQVLAARRPARLGADDQLRVELRHGAGGDRAAAGQLAVAGEIVNAQSGYWFGCSASGPKWFVFLQAVGFFIFMTAGIAETNRAPFDFPEAEQELVAGYHTEYSSMSFALFFLAEYVNMVTVSAVATNLYLGGWHGPLLPEWLGILWWFCSSCRRCCSSICGCAGRCRGTATTTDAVRLEVPAAAVHPEPAR